MAVGAFVSALGSVVFLLAPAMLAVFGVLAGLAGVVLGGVQLAREHHWMASTGLGVGLASGLLLLQAL